MPIRPRTPEELPPHHFDVEENDRMREARLVVRSAYLHRSIKVPDERQKQEYYVDQYGNVAKRRQPPSLRKFKEEPLVPLGVLATAGCLLAASRSFRKGDAGRMNRFLWWRVYTQGATVVAMLIGGVWWESRRAQRTEDEARLSGFDVESARLRAGWTADGTQRLNGRKPPPGFFDFLNPLYRAMSDLRRT